MNDRLKPRVPKPGETRRRRPRLSPEQSGQRVLDAAISALRSDGLAFGLERVSFEDAIRAADVSRTAAYRRWPHKDAFLADLAVELAELAIPVVPTRASDATLLIRAVVEKSIHRLATPAGRRDVLDEVVRVTAADDFNADRVETVRWRTYFALVMSVESMPEGDLRTKVAAAVTRADDLLVDRIADNYRRVVEYFGFRVRGDYRSLATIGLALMRGLVIGEMVKPGTVIGAPEDQLPAVAFATLIRSAVEVDDDATWDAETLDAKVAALEVDDLFIGAGQSAER